jgi:hypothetical protein
MTSCTSSRPGPSRRRFTPEEIELERQRICRLDKEARRSKLSHSGHEALQDPALLAREPREARVWIEGFSGISAAVAWPLGLNRRGLAAP